MESFKDLLAVVTGGGTGMGRELVVQLAAEGCSVATCDVNADNMKETALRAEDAAPSGTTVTTHVCDVADEAAVLKFRDEVVGEHGRDHINLLFNNAGVGGGGGFIAGRRDEWDRTFAICWGGVYNCTRAFVDLLIASESGYLINTSSVNGFWASIGPGIPHTAYSTAKFAVRGFTEALIEDFRVNAPHVKVAVVHPGHIGTDIVINSRKLLGGDEALTEEGLEQFKEMMGRRGMPAEGVTVEQAEQMMTMMGEMFREGAPVSAAQAATAILDGVKAGKWRILIGDDAVALDKMVRENPEDAYKPGGFAFSFASPPGAADQTDAQPSQDAQPGEARQQGERRRADAPTPPLHDQA